VYLKTYLTRTKLTLVITQLI